MLNFIKRLRHRFIGNYIRNPGNVETDFIEAPVRIDNDTFIGANTHIGRHTYIGKRCYVMPTSFEFPTEIGRFCSIGSCVTIGAAEHPTNWLSTSHFQYHKDKLFQDMKVNIIPFIASNPQNVLIGNDIWIGNNALIKSGVKIGNGAIIGSGAIVVKDVPDYAIVGGCPAKLIRYRFERVIVERLNALQWWNLDVNLIKKVPFNDIYQAVEFLEKNNSQYVDAINLQRK